MTCLEFFRRVLRVTLTIGQSAFVAVAIDKRLPRELTGKMRDAAIEMFGDIDELTPLALRTIVAVCGRDSGKTELSAGIGLYLMMTADLRRVGPGDLATVGVVAPRAKTARIALGRAIALVRRAPELKKRVVRETRESFTLRRHDGREVAFEVFAASRGGASLRGPSFIALILDEAAQFRDASAAVNDEAIYAAAMPRILRLALFLSTPWAQEGLLWRLASENAGAPHTALVATASTLLMRDNDPDLAMAIEAERARDADNCEREFFAKFMNVGGSLFLDGKSIEEAIDDQLEMPAPVLDDEVVGCGADIGLVQDSSAIVPVGARGEGRRLLRVLNVVEMRPRPGAPLKLSEVVLTFSQVCQWFRVDGFYADQHARQPAREHAANNNVTIYSRPEGPNVIFDLNVQLRQALNDRRIALPRHPRLLAQLRALTARPLAGGLWKISSPRRVGMAHGDLVSALVLGVHAATVTGSSGWTEEDMVRFSRAHATDYRRYEGSDYGRGSSRESPLDPKPMDIGYQSGSPSAPGVWSVPRRGGGGGGFGGGGGGSGFGDYG